MWIHTIRTKCITFVGLLVSACDSRWRGYAIKRRGIAWIPLQRAAATKLLSNKISRQLSRGMFGYASYARNALLVQWECDYSRFVLSALLLLFHLAHMYACCLSVSFRCAFRFVENVKSQHQLSQLRTNSFRLIHSPSGCWSVRYDVRTTKS